MALGRSGSSKAPSSSCNIDPFFKFGIKKHHQTKYRGGFLLLRFWCAPEQKQSIWIGHSTNKLRAKTIAQSTETFCVRAGGLMAGTNDKPLVLKSNFKKISVIDL